MLVFSVKNAKIPENFHQNSWILDNFLEKAVTFWKKCENAKTYDEIWLKFWILSGAKACKSCRSRQELSNEIAIQTSIDLQNSASIQPRTSLSKFAKNWPQVRIKVRKNIGSGPWSRAFGSWPTWRCPSRTSSRDGGKFAWRAAALQAAGRSCGKR